MHAFTLADLIWTDGVLILSLVTAGSGVLRLVSGARGGREAGGKLARLPYASLLASIWGSCAGLLYAIASTLADHALNTATPRLAQGAQVAVLFAWGFGFGVGVVSSGRYLSRGATAPPSVPWGNLALAGMFVGLIAVALIAHVIDALQGSSLLTIGAVLAFAVFSPSMAWWLGKLMVEHRRWSAVALLAFAVVFTADGIWLGGAALR